MGKLLLSVHVLASIIFIGPVTVAVSLFPRYARLALVHRAPLPHLATGDAGAPTARAHDAAPDAAAPRHLGTGDAQAEPVARLLHRISRVYAVLGLSVPVLGIAVAVQLGVLGDAWLLASITLTLLAAALLAAGVLPSQQRAIALLDEPRDEGDVELTAAVDEWIAGAQRLGMSSGMFALLWAIVVVLMVVRPGSTTGV